jgi:hypothetical protein
VRSTAGIPPEGRRPAPSPPPRPRPRVFSSSRGQPGFRRATDVFLLVPALVGLAVLIAAYPPSRFERSLARFLASFPHWLDPLWDIFYDTFGLLAIVLVVVAVASRRHAVWLQAVASVVAAAAATLVAARLALGHWPDVEDVLRLRADASTFPVLRVAMSAAIVLAVSPHLVRPLQTAVRWVLLLGIAGAVLAETAPPSATLAAFLVALVAATAVRLAFGTSAGHPEAEDVEAALRELGVPVEHLEATARQPAGVFLARGRGADGRPLLVKVYGRDAYDTQLLEKGWRTVLYAGSGPRVRLSRLEAAEHEALATLLARQAGVATREVVIAAESSTGDALLVFRDESRPLAALSPEEIDDILLARSWQAIVTLGDAGIAHHRIDPETVAVIDGTVGVIELDRATIAPPPDQVLTDRAQLLAATAALADVERAIAAAMSAIGADGIAALLP